MNKLLIQFIIVTFTIITLLGVAIAKDENRVTNISVVRLNVEIYNELEKSFNSILKNEFKDKVNIKTVSVKDKVEDVEAALKVTISTLPDIIVTYGTTPAKLACPMLKNKGIPLIYIGVTEPALIGVEDNKNSVCNCTGVKWDVSPKVAFKFFEQVSPKVKKVAVLYNENFPQDTTYIQRIKDIQKGIKYKLTFISFDNNSKDKILKLKRKDFDFVVPWYGFTRLETPLTQVKTLIVDNMDIPVFYGDTLAGEKTGAVVSIGPNLTYAGSQAAIMAKKIIKGQSARDIPTEDPHLVFTVINMTMARKFGLKMPNQILESAHKIITQ